jgi:hypothetical protein
MSPYFRHGSRRSSEAERGTSLADRAANVYGPHRQFLLITNWHRAHRQSASNPPSDPQQLAGQAYLAVLSRMPTPTESAAKYLQTRQIPREQLCRDIVWALLNSAEFRFNH